jgi:carboxylesterase
VRAGYDWRKGRFGVLLLHGLTGTPEEVRPLGEHLSRHGYSVLIPWLAGHGTHPRDLARTRWQDWSQSAREALSHLKKRCGRVVVGGLSMGACQALHLASHEKVDGVISMAGLYRLADWRFNLIGFFKLFQWRTGRLRGGVVDPQAPPHATYEYAPTSSLHELKKLMDHMRDDLAFVKVPALVAHGALDPMVAPANADHILEALGSPLKHRLILPRSGHVLPMDQDREILFRKIRLFLRSGGKRVC